MYATAATAASTREQLFVALSEEHKQLAAHHGVQVDQAEDSLAHFGLIGANREIQDHEFDYDLMGNLIARSDHAMDLHETFGYDPLNRLETSQLSGSGSSLYQLAGLDTVTITYDLLGNIQHKSDVGSYGYTGAGPHAVTEIIGIRNRSYQYDANGNMISGDGRTFKELGTDHH